MKRLYFILIVLLACLVSSCASGSTSYCFVEDESGRIHGEFVSYGYSVGDTIQLSDSYLIVVSTSR